MLLLVQVVVEIVQWSGGEEYVEKIVNILENISSEIVIHRMTGDGDRETLVAPLWSIKKIDVLNSIHKELKRRNTYQGRLYRGGLRWDLL